MDKTLYAIKMQELMDILGVDMPDEMIIKYYSVINEYLTDVEFERAMERLAFEWEPYGKEYPSINDFLKRAKPLDEEIEIIALNAFNIVKDSAIEHGPYKSVIFEDIVINNVIYLTGGWEKFCNNILYAGINEEYVKKEFIKIYKNLVKTRRVKDINILYGRDYYLNGDSDKSDEVKIVLIDYKPLIGWKNNNVLIANVSKQ